jgi:thymidylate synthase (FAD)
MMKVEIVNKEELKDFYKNWGIFACECYNTPVKYAEKVGKTCFESGHYSGSRTQYICFKISGISRSCSLQLNRHNIGVVLNQQSQRYVDMNNVDFVIPPQISKSEEAIKVYTELMEHSKEAYEQIQLILRENGRTKEQSNEDARFCLLEACETSGTWGFTYEALEHFMNMRLCSRSQWEIRQLANEMRKAVLEIFPEWKDRLQPICEKLSYCPEDKCCGRKYKKTIEK